MIDFRDTEQGMEATAAWEKLVKRGEKEIGEKDEYLDSFRELLRTYPGYKDPSRELEREVIDGPTTLGMIVDVLYYGWGLWEDPSMLLEDLQDIVKQMS